MRPLTGVLASIALASGVAGGQAATPAPGDSRADISGLPDGVAPWWPSRYGADDQIGSLNEITPAGVLAAVALVKRGVVADLGRVLDEATPKFPGRY